MMREQVEFRDVLLRPSQERRFWNLRPLLQKPQVPPCNQLTYYFIWVVSICSSLESLGSNRIISILQADLIYLVLSGSQPYL